MKTTLMIAGLAALATAVAVPAFAQDSASTTSGVYGSVGIIGDKTHRSDANLNGLNLRLGDRFNRNWGMEGEAAFGTNKDSTPTGDYRLKDKVGVYGVGYVPVGDFDLLGRVGIADTQMKMPTGVPKNETGTSLDYGVGAQYHMAQGYALRADITKSDYNDHRGTATTSTLNLVKSF